MQPSCLWRRRPNSLIVFYRASTHQLLVFDPNRPWDFH